MRNILGTLFIIMCCAVTATATPRWSRARIVVPDELVADTAAPRVPDAIDSMMMNLDYSRYRPVLPPGAYGPAVFDRYYVIDTVKAAHPGNHMEFMVPEATRWLESELLMNRMLRGVKQSYMIGDPASIRYNVRFLPEPPPEVEVIPDPRRHKFSIERLSTLPPGPAEVLPDAFVHKNWLNTFESSLQFSQSYLSPNWYKGGQGNLNAIGQVVWNNKLNTVYHPNIMFETTVQYKLAMNNAPDDTLHTYNVAEDNFRINSKFGVKAFNRWFYSLTLQFKTQFLHSYQKNTSNMLAAFLSPAELNMGLGMTYNYANPKGTLAFDASISPVAWNLKTCSNHRIDPASVGITNGRRVDNQIGFNAECKMRWNICKNITYTSRLFTFTDYSYIQGDWENTFQFDINRFLSTQVFVHLRYDSSVKLPADASWRYWQLKEILSFGFSYRFDGGRG